MITEQLTPLPCFMVNNLTKNSAEQCKFVIDNDCLEDESVIDYVYLVYCDFGNEMRFAAILLIVFLVIVLFLNLSAVADEFLCPSLLNVAKSLRMSDSLAGVTLLAFGNGCPDIFASLAAASSNRPELIVGELLGAGIFCTSIVAGLIFIHSDFKSACRPLLRDATFYLLAVYLVWLYCWDQKITFYGSLAFIIIYVIYLIVALSGQAIHSRLRGSYPIADTQRSNDTEEKEKNENWFKWREESLRRRSLCSLHKDENLETNPLASSAKIQYKNNGVTSIYVGSDSFNSNKQMPVGIHLSSCSKKSNQGHVNKAFEQDAHDKDMEIAVKRMNKEQQANQQQQQRTMVIKLEPPANVIQKSNRFTLNEWDDFLQHINPIDSDNWNESGLCGKLISILRAPLLFATIITIPVVDNEKRGNNWCRLLNSMHCILVPIAIVASTKWGSYEDLAILGMPIKALFLVPGLLLAVFTFKTTNAHQPPNYHVAFAYVGFIMSVVWIYTLATEIISLLKTVGIIFSMTDTAIGLGVLAWGNSLGDIVANLSLADAGYPRMALGASIGAPLLNLLLGFGLSFTIYLKPGESTQIVYSPTITLLCSTLAIVLVSLMLSTLAPAERSKKPFGYLLIFSYGVYFLLAVCLECGLINV